MGPVQERHRPGSLKQQNKSHKHGRHKSKGALDKIAKGLFCTLVFLQSCMLVHGKRAFTGPLIVSFKVYYLVSLLHLKLAYIRQVIALQN